jgi:hypothetical protein
MIKRKFGGPIETFYLVEEYQNRRLWVYCRIAAYKNDELIFEAWGYVPIRSFDPRWRFRIKPGDLYQHVDGDLIRPVPSEFKYPAQWWRHLREARAQVEQISTRLKWD